jgi:DNA modification methylase
MHQESPTAVIHLADSRLMSELGDGAVDLAVTSPPYWHIKDYDSPGQIGYGQSLHEYLASLFLVWRECRRVLGEGGRLCVNVGDQFARSVVYGRYRVIPLHAEIIRQCELLELDFLGSIVWQKRTTMNTSGGAVIMGSFPFPPNGIVELDYEHILIFKKPGKSRTVAREIKEASRLTTEEWKSFFSGHWSFAGARKSGGHEAAFPEELPRRLIRMFSYKGDTVLDPFLGSGTTAVAALELGRSAVGYEINEEFARMAQARIRNRLGPLGGDAALCMRARDAIHPVEEASYKPGIADAQRPRTTEKKNGGIQLHSVVAVLDDCAIELDSGEVVRFLGVRISDRETARRYMKEKLLRKKVFLRDALRDGEGPTAAYVYLKNRIFVNAYLIKSGMATPDGSRHRHRKRFEAMREDAAEA